MVNNTSLLKSIFNNLWLGCNVIKSGYHPSGTEWYHDTHSYKSIDSVPCALYIESTFLQHTKTKITHVNDLLQPY